MHNIFKRTLIFDFLFILFLLLGGYLLIAYSPMEVYLNVNSHNTVFLDTFFKYTTQIGHGILTIIIVLALLFWRIRYSIILLASYLSSGLISQLLKRVIFDDWLRPAAYCDSCHFIEGVKLHFQHSFPSGHTVTAFALFLCLSYFIGNKSLQVLFFLLALIIGYSRIYLSQHFFTDVYFGAVIGVIFAFFSILRIQNVKAEWLDNSIVNIRKIKTNAK
ncbi:MAG: phosphatase PAP2 family protein [Bacteroidales bacterium]|nr:phosphatase PAP2 family protein [Bacteroidales bacterium]